VRRYGDTLRLACQAKVTGDVEVRTMPNAVPPRETTTWPPDSRPAKWKERLSATTAPPAAKPLAEPPPAGAAPPPTSAAPATDKPDA
jgi:hypothetical protein